VEKLRKFYNIKQRKNIYMGKKDETLRWIQDVQVWLITPKKRDNKMQGWKTAKK
jgi:hypothetical protein